VSIKHVMLGFLSQTPMTGYDLKKKFASSGVFHWSGNNNQIYKTLVALHEEKLVTLELQYQESKPPRKIYTITEKGRATLHEWLQSVPELPQIQHALLMQLTWADQLEKDQVVALLDNYHEELQAYITVLREQARRAQSGEMSAVFSFADRVAQHWIDFYELELEWVQTLRQEIDER
jgi:PadR family transcriptional regulator, regulatory protein AphA